RAWWRSPRARWARSRALLSGSRVPPTVTRVSKAFEVPVLGSISGIDNEGRAAGLGGGGAREGRRLRGGALRGAGGSMGGNARAPRQRETARAQLGNRRTAVGAPLGVSSRHTSRGERVGVGRTPVRTLRRRHRGVQSRAASDCRRRSGRFDPRDRYLAPPKD